MNPKKSLLIISHLALCALCSLPALAAELKTKSTAHESTPPADPSGTWTWTTPLAKGIPERKHVLTLKLDGDALIGSLLSPGATRSGNATPITAARLDHDKMSFTVTRQFGNNTIIQKFNGTLTNDIIKGNITFDIGGKTNSAPWTAKRESEATAQDSARRPNGTFARPGSAGAWQFSRPARGANQSTVPSAGTNTNHTQ